MVKLQALATDPSAEDTGAWVTHPSGLRFRLRRMSSPIVRNAFKAHQLATGEAFSINADMIGTFGPLVAEHVVCDWEGVEADKDDDAVAPAGHEGPVMLSYDAHSFGKKLATRAYKDLLAWIVNAATIADNYRAERIAEDAGN